MVGLLTTGFAGGLIGFAAAGTPEPELPDQARFALPRVGDRGEYTVTGVRTGPDGPVVDQPERPAVDFEWLSDTSILDAQGTERHVHRLKYWPHEAAYDPFWTQMDETPALFLVEAGSNRLVAVDYHKDEDNASDGNTYSMELLRRSYPGPGFSLRAVDWVRPMCGVLHNLQGKTWQLDDQVNLLQDCMIGGTPFHGNLNGGGNTFRAVAVEAVGGEDAIVFASLQRWVGEPGINTHSGGDWYVWLSQKIPYPLRIIEQRVNGTGYDVYRLSRFSAGAVPVAAAGLPVAGAAPPLQFASPKPWGMEDVGVQHPFPASDAYAQAVTHEDAEDLRRLLRDHPDAFTYAAGYWELHEPQEVRREWSFAIAGGTESVRVTVTQVTRPLVLSSTGLSGLGSPFGSEIAYEYRDGAPIFAPPPREYLPAAIPTAASMLARWSAYAAPGDQARPNGWAFILGCDRHADGCVPVYSFEAGRVRWETTNDDPVGLTGRTGVRQESVLTVSLAGEATSFVRYAGQSRSSLLMNPLEGPRGGGPPATASSLPDIVEVELWSLPTGKWAVAAGLVGMIAALAYWIWPTIKGSVLTPLFSRLVRPRALDHPVRAQLAALVEAEPGIHFQEIARRTRLGNGTVEHHLRKLVDVGIIAEQVGVGFTCYFVKGQVDRRVMAASPILKSSGARRVLEAAGRRPASPLSQLAMDASLTVASASYHVKRMVAAGLLTARSEGRESRITLTDAGVACRATMGTAS